MEKVTLGEGILSALFIIASVVRYFQNRNATETLKQASQNAANSAVIKVSEEGDITRDEVKKMIDAAITAIVNERLSHAAVINEFRKVIDVLIRNTKNVCTKVGVRWEDEVTVVKETKE